MNALLGIAKVAKRYKRMRIVETLAIQRHRQYQKKWAKEKIAAPTATDPLELTWD